MRRPFVRLGRGYGDFVAKAVKVKLQKLKPFKHVFKVNGKPLVSGAFAVGKDALENRAISAICPLNDMVDDGKLH